MLLLIVIAIVIVVVVVVVVANSRSYKKNTSSVYVVKSLCLLGHCSSFTIFNKRFNL